MAARLVRKRPVNMGDVVRMLREFVNTRAMIDKLSKKVDDKETGLGLKQQLIAAVTTAGYESDGHLWLDLPEEVEGFAQLKYEKRQPQDVLNAERTLAFLRRKKLLDEVAPVIEVREIDEDKLVALAFEKRITEAELRKLYDTPEAIWAFRPVKA